MSLNFSYKTKLVCESFAQSISQVDIVVQHSPHTIPYIFSFHRYFCTYICTYIYSGPSNPYCVGPNPQPFLFFSSNTRCLHFNANETEYN